MFEVFSFVMWIDGLKNWNAEESYDLY